MARVFKMLLVVWVCLAFTQCTERSLPPHSVSPVDKAMESDASAERVKYYDESLMSKRDLARLDNEFGFKLFKEIVRAHPDENVFVSPLSVSVALGMTVNGAAGSTLDAMLYALNLDDYPVWLINPCYENLIEHLRGLDSEVQYEIANSVWCCDGVAVEQAFLNACRTYFDAQVRSVVFTEAGTPDTMNAWVNRKTHGKIPSIVESPIDPYMTVILLNAMYFLGTWANEFDPQETDDDLFELPDGSWAPCRMMERPGLVPGLDNPGCKYAYLNHSDLQGVDLAYGDSVYSMTVLQPREGKHVDSLISMLNQDTWDGWMGSLCEDYTYGRVLMPKFELEFTYDLKGVLQTLGMGIAFDPGQADFSRICSYVQLWISRVKHKTYVRVDEAGTEAAAVTEVDIPRGIHPCPLYFEMYINKPFVFVIREKCWGTILFIGKIVNPGYL